MKKRLQVCLNDEAWAAVEAVTNEAVDNFNVGTISWSDVVNEMILCSKVDIKELRNKHTDFRRTLRVLAKQENPDAELVKKTLNELKILAAKLSTKPTLQEEAT